MISDPQQQVHHAVETDTFSTGMSIQTLPTPPLTPATASPPLSPSFTSSTISSHRQREPVLPSPTDLPSSPPSSNGSLQRLHFSRSRDSSSGGVCSSSPISGETQAHEERSQCTSRFPSKPYSAQQVLTTSTAKSTKFETATIIEPPHPSPSKSITSRQQLHAASTLTPTSTLSPPSSSSSSPPEPLFSSSSYSLSPWHVDSTAGELLNPNLTTRTPANAAFLPNNYQSDNLGSNCSINNNSISNNYNAIKTSCSTPNANTTSDHTHLTYPSAIFNLASLPTIISDTNLTDVRNDHADLSNSITSNPTSNRSNVADVDSYQRHDNTERNLHVYDRNSSDNFRVDIKEEYCGSEEFSTLDLSPYLQDLDIKPDMNNISRRDCIKHNYGIGFNGTDNSGNSNSSCSSNLYHSSEIDYNSPENCYNSYYNNHNSYNGRLPPITNFISSNRSASLSEDYSDGNSVDDEDDGEMEYAELNSVPFHCDQGLSADLFWRDPYLNLPSCLPNGAHLDSMDTEDISMDGYDNYENRTTFEQSSPVLCPLQNVGIQEAAIAPCSHIFGSATQASSTTTVPYAIPDYHHYASPTSDSDKSDEGFEEGVHNPDEKNLPVFEKLQTSDSANVHQRHRSSTLSPREKKKASSESPTSDKERKKPGRKPGQVSNVLHLWEFMRDLLKSENNRGIIDWISKRDGVFRVINSTEVARLWGEQKKNKKKMTYEKLSRSIRYSRLEGYFSDLPKDKDYPKKLCFKFGPRSKDWG